MKFSTRVLSFLYLINIITSQYMYITPLKEENITKYFEIYLEEDKNKLNNFANLKDDIFLNVDKELERIKEEEERKRKEEEERLRKLKEAEELEKKLKILRRKNR